MKRVLQAWADNPGLRPFIITPSHRYCYRQGLVNCHFTLTDSGEEKLKELKDEAGLEAPYL